MPIYLYTQDTDMRKGAEGLSGIVRQHMQGDPLDGSLFLFINRRRDRMKMLHWDGGGYWVFYRVLEAGTFERLASEQTSLQLDPTQLAMLLGGMQLASAARRKRHQQGSRKAG
jgi:transposase